MERIFLFYSFRKCARDGKEILGSFHHFTGYKGPWGE
jgi:hypothetical protein